MDEIGSLKLKTLKNRCIMYLLFKTGTRGRFPIGRGGGFRNEGMRGRGNFSGGRGYNREFSSGGRGNGRGGDGYQRNRGMGVSKNMAPRVPASA